jgi:hypothetical protein
MKAEPNGAAVISFTARYLHNVKFLVRVSAQYMFNQFLASKGYGSGSDYRGSDMDGIGERRSTGTWAARSQDQVMREVGKASKSIQADQDLQCSYGGNHINGFFTESPFRGRRGARSVTDWAHTTRATPPIFCLPQNDTSLPPVVSYLLCQVRPLMAHGMVGTNVHFQDIVRLTQRFIELGKTRWELAAYPVEDHAFVRPSSWADEYRRIFELFERYLPARTTNK